jgi:hypothetical protein
MRSEAEFGTASVRYASVGAGFRGASGPPTVAEPATDGHGPAYGLLRTSPRTEAVKATDGTSGSGYSDYPNRIHALTSHFMMSAGVAVTLVAGFCLVSASQIQRAERDRNGASRTRPELARSVAPVACPLWLRIRWRLRLS